MSRRSSVHVPAEMFPVASFVEEELEARKIRLDAFLHVIGITMERWRELQGGASMLLGECERIANALSLNPIFISNLNLMWNEWKRRIK
jgi:hypothetical protein